MHQLSLYSQIGLDLRAARKQQKFTQVEVAVLAGVSLPTLRQSEAGKGTLGTFERLAAALGLVITARYLPPGDQIGPRLAVLRSRKAISRRSLAALAGCSPTTLAGLEAGENGHLAVAARVAEALGVRLRLSSPGTVEDFWTSTGMSTVQDTWTTPVAVLEALYPVVGGTFGLDPCSPVRSGKKALVRARLRLTMKDDGLNRPWRASTVFLNPPYGRQLSAWLGKARAEVAAGRSGAVIALIPARTDTRWWHEHVAGVSDVWLLRGRLAFGDGANYAPFPSAIVVWSACDEHRTKMSLAFPDAWHVPVRPRSNQLKPVDLVAMSST